MTIVHKGTNRATVTLAASQVKYETRKAYLFNSRDKPVWVPKSACNLLWLGSGYAVEIAQWFYRAHKDELDDIY